MADARRALPSAEEVASDLAHGAPLALSLTCCEAFVLVTQLQLALRHPGNTGAPAVVARAIVDGLIPPLTQSRPALAAIIEAGWDASADVVLPFVPRVRSDGTPAAVDGVSGENLLPTAAGADRGRRWDASGDVVLP